MSFLHKYMATVFGAVINHVGYRIHKFVQRLAKKIKPKQSILDVGAGTMPYKSYFAHCDYKAQDFASKKYGLDYGDLDYVSEIYTIPVPDESFDYVLCTQVLEHLKDPRAAYAELFRILKPKGELWLSCPGAWEEHDTPYDFFRYTRYSLRMLGEEAGFKVVDIQQAGGRFIVLSKMLKDLVPGMISGSRNLYLVVYFLWFPLVLPFLVILYLLDSLDKKQELTLNYEAVYKKK